MGFVPLHNRSYTRILEISAVLALLRGALPAWYFGGVGTGPGGLSARTILALYVLHLARLPVWPAWPCPAALFPFPAMNVKYFALGGLTLAAAACQKDPSAGEPAPTADFAFARSSASELTVATYDNVYLVDHSTRAVAYRYTLGNDSVRTTAAPRFSYAKPGLYTVTLTVRGAGGQTATASKRVRVRERVAKQVVIQNLLDEVNSPQHNLVNGTYWAVVRLGENRAHYPRPANGDPSFEAPILYQSPKVRLTQAMLPYAFALPMPLVLNYPALRANTLQNNPNSYGYAGVGYGFEVYEQDANGAVFLLTSSYLPFYRAQSGGISEMNTGFERNVLQVGYGGIYLSGDFE